MKTFQEFLAETTIRRSATHSQILSENIEDRHSEAWDDHDNLIKQVKDQTRRKEYEAHFLAHDNRFANAYEGEGSDDELEDALDGMHQVNDMIRNHIKTQN